LELAIDKLRPLFKRHGAIIPQNVRVTVGFTSRGGKKAIGQVWSDTSSEGGFYEVFIHPSLAQQKALGVLVHELVHVCVGLVCGHKGKFRKLAKAVGLEGKMTATTESPALIDELNSLDLPKFPHFILNTDAISTAPKKQTIRMHKAICECCDYTIRISQKWIDEVGLPDCPRCKETLQLG
jgi:hypothetical protein